MKDEPVEVALKPCPFCGCETKLVERPGENEYHGPRTWYLIEGKHHGIGGVCPGQVRGRGSKETAAAAWNTRAAEQALATIEENSHDRYTS